MTTALAVPPPTPKKTTTNSTIKEKAKAYQFDGRAGLSGSSFIPYQKT
jgi:hypothetical protein